VCALFETWRSVPDDLGLYTDHALVIEARALVAK